MRTSLRHRDAPINTPTQNHFPNSPYLPRVFLLDELEPEPALELVPALPPLPLDLPPPRRVGSREPFMVEASLLGELPPLPDFASDIVLLSESYRALLIHSPYTVSPTCDFVVRWPAT